MRPAHHASGRAATAPERSVVADDAGPVRLARMPSKLPPEDPPSEIADAWLSADPLPPDPFPPLARWLSEAFEDGRQPAPHAVALATVDEAGDPTVRMVLVQRIEPEPGALVFFTHYDSPKGRDLERLGRAATAFHFGPLGRQARITGQVARIAPDESDAYFASRPLDAQIGAWASRQSQPLEDRATLLAEMDRVADRFGADLGTADPTEAEIPRPPGWGGFRLVADRVELWHSRPGRIHDRAEWHRDGSSWRAARLYP